MRRELLPLTAAAPTPATLESARIARQAGVAGLVVHDDEATGLAAIGVLRVSGPDAAAFLHSQLTNEVTGLAVGAGNLCARVDRTGHLIGIFSLHRVDDDAFLLLMPRDQVPVLLDDLDRFLFADQVELTDETARWWWLLLQGPAADDVAARASDGDSDLHEGHTRPMPDGSLLVRRSLTGDVGYLVGWQAQPDLSRWRKAAEDAEVAWLPAPALAEAVEVLRIEAGQVRMGADTPDKPRRLHETGLEQFAVSYTKGCYLGQEVIARARTYGSVPRALRALVFTDKEALQQLPGAGAPVTVGGAAVGTLASRTWSVVKDAPLALAYLARSHRTPGMTITLDTGGAALQATVALTPIYRASDHAGRVASLYDQAIRVFAEGDESGALTFLERALRLDPTFIDGYEAVGVILGRAGKLHEAIDVFRRLEEVAPDEPLVNTNLSLYYMKLGDRTTAEDESSKATVKSMARAAAEARGEAKDVAKIAEEQAAKRLADAQRKQRMFRQVLEFDPVDPIALFGLGSALSVLGQHDEAIEILGRAVEVDAKNSAVYLARGKALEAVGRSDDAIATYQAGMDVASRRGDLMPLKEMEHRVLLLGGRRRDG